MKVCGMCGLGVKIKNDMKAGAHPVRPFFTLLEKGNSFINRPFRF